LNLSSIDIFTKGTIDIFFGVVISDVISISKGVSLLSAFEGIISKKFNGNIFSSVSFALTFSCSIFFSCDSNLSLFSFRSLNLFLQYVTHPKSTKNLTDLTNPILLS